jgi:hypothetical protein
MNACKAGLAALYPARLVLRGLQDPAVLGDDALRQGVYAIVAEGMSGWVEYVGREADFGTLRFAIVAYGRVSDDGTTEDVETLEEQLETELLAWCQAIKAAPVDAVYPRKTTYSRGLDFPVAWLVMELEALYV